MIRTSYKTGYGQRQAQRETAARMLLNGLEIELVSAHLERKYDILYDEAVSITRSVEKSLQGAER